MKDYWLLSCVLGLFSMQFLAAQQPIDFQIMVNGPWTYVGDPDPSQDPNSNADKRQRIFLVAPAHTSHNGYIFAGRKASSDPQQSDQIATGRYYFDVDNRTFAGSREAHELPPEIYPAPQQVDSKKINDILYTYTPDPKKQRYAISLPTPDYYTTYFGDYGLGLAESKIDVNDITESTRLAYYATWTVFHYQLKSDIVTLQKSFYPDNGSLISDPKFAVSDNGLSVVIRVGSSGLSTLYCDSLSTESFSATKELWGLMLHARFPEQFDITGTQKHGVYHGDCLEAFDDSAQSAFEKEVKDQQKNRCAISVLQGVLELEASAQQRPSARRSLYRNSPMREPGCPRSDRKQSELALDIRRALTTLTFGMPPDNIKRDLSCMDDLVKSPAKATCGRADWVPKNRIELNSNNLSHDIFAKSLGSTDCHAAQMSINGAIP